jgi:hypothetical protein
LTCRDGSLTGLLRKVLLLYLRSTIPSAAPPTSPTPPSRSTPHRAAEQIPMAQAWRRTAINYQHHLREYSRRRLNKQGSGQQLDGCLSRRNLPIDSCGTEGFA